MIITTLITERTKKRKIFEETDSVIHTDGSPINKAAEPECKVCRGFGIVDDGELMAMYVKCQKCWTDE